MKLKLLTKIAAASAFLSITGMVQAQLVTNITIYQDNFGRSGVLSGSAPDTVNLPGATWYACDNAADNAVLMTDGASIACTNVPIGSSVYLNGFLPFTPQFGHRYTLSAKISAQTGGANWLAMGFATQPITNNFYAAVNCGSEWMLVRGNGSGIQAYETPGGGSTATVNATFGTGTNLFTVVLDTATNGTTAVNANYGWVEYFYTNGVQVATYRIPYGNPPIQYVGIGAASATGYFQQFTLTDILLFQGVPTIVEQPQNATAQAGSTATFWVGVTNDFPSAAYQWVTISGGVTNAIAGATNASYTTPALDMTYNGLNYGVTITNALGSTNGAPATLTVVSGPPTVFSATKTASPTSIVVNFSKPVDPVTGLNAANYSLSFYGGGSSGISIVSASYGSASNNVILTTSTLNTNAGYYLTVQHVQDLFGSAMSSNVVPVLPAGLVFFVRADSGVVVDNNGEVAQWLDQTTNGNNASQFFGVPSAGSVYTGPATRPGTNIFNGVQPTLTFGTPVAPKWLQAPSTPSLASMLTNTTMYAVMQYSNGTGGMDIVNKNWGNLPAPFDWAPTSGETVQYGNGYNNQAGTGTGGTIFTATPYVLTSMLAVPVPVSTTNNCAFWLNGLPNGTNSVKPVTGNPGGIYDGGRPLWIGARWDLVNVRMEGQIAEIMLFNQSLSGADRTNVDNYLGNKYFPFSFTQNLPSSVTSSNGFAVTYSIAATVGSAHGLTFQWQENGTNIPGATGLSYTTPILVPANSGETFDVVATLPNGSTSNSITSTLTVLSVRPYTTYAGITIWSPTNVVVFFDEPVSPISASAATNYYLNNGATVVSAAMGDAPNKVILTTSPLTWNANPGFYSLTVSNVVDLLTNAIVPATIPVGLYPNAAVWVQAATGVTADGSGNVSQWNDLSGNANDLYTISAIDPLLATNSMGNPVIRFTGTNANEMDGFPDSSVAITGDMSVIAVINFATLAGGTNGEIVSKVGSSPNNSIAAPYDYYMGTTGSLLYRGNGGGSGNGTSYGGYSSTNAPTVGAPHIIVASDLGDNVSDSIDGVSAGVGPLSNNYQETNDADSGNDISIGMRQDSHNRLTGDILELIVASTPLSSNDIISMDYYLGAKYGLPVGTNSLAIITQQPVASTNASLYSTLMVPVGVSGNPLAMQWYDTNGITIVGQTNATLVIPDIMVNDSYYLVATNIYGSVTSSVVSVTVISGPPQIFTQPQTTYSYVSNSVSLSVGAYGTAPLAYQWQFLNGSSWVNLTNNGGLTGSQSATLAISQLLPSEAGNYQVIVTNLSGSTTSSVAAIQIIGQLPVTFESGLSWFSPANSLAKFTNNLLVLTTNGAGQSSYFFQIPQYIGAFQVSFTYQAGYAGTVPLADGTAFVLQDDPRGTSAIGTAGGELCYGSTGGTQITPSVALCLILYPGDAVNGTGYSLGEDGVIAPSAKTGAVNLTNAIATLGAGDPITINMNYANGNVALTFTDLVTTASFSTNQYVGSIAGILGTNTAYIGFTAAQGGDTSVQTITNFSFISIPIASAQVTAGTNVVVSWPGSVVGYTLQQNPSLTTTNWLNVTNQVTLTNGLNTVATPEGGSQMFYRLILTP